jgi:transposase-like protein
MYDVNDDAKGGFRRIEILTGRGRRRRWSPEEKGRIVAETLEPGAQVWVSATTDLNHLSAGQLAIFFWTVLRR